MELLGLLITIGIISGGIAMGATQQDYNDTINELDETKKDIEEQQKAAEELAKLEYAAAKEEAGKQADKLEKNADITDKSLNVSERTLSDSFNQNLGQLQTEQESNLWNWNNALSSVGATKGNELAQLANSGVRAGSSLSEAVELEASANNANIARERAYTERSEKYTLASLFSNQAQGENSIWSSRVGADQDRLDATDLRTSYEEGGTEYNLFQKKLANQNLQYQQKLDAIEREKTTRKKNLPYDYISAFFGTGYQGYSAASSLLNTASYL